MPRIFIPEGRDATELAYALEVFSLPARTIILVELMKHGPALRADLMERLKMESQLVGRTLGDLEELGMVTADLPAGQRRGRSVKYSVDMDRYLKSSTAMQRFLSPR
ncbi:MarR family transcriptional regulator [Paenarthrobacter histidinolovorans]|uniref:DNA-binding transcriptional ArsR family regulator n=1 Tax=Paenarthrobacter histidinolovorans TaxID=43664 RepID=A0ABW8MZH4_9MICC